MKTKPEAGKAYRCPDGVTRWVTGVSTRGYLQLRWRDDSGAWCNGGIMKLERWLKFWPSGCVEIPAPQPGEVIQVLTPMGFYEQRQVAPRPGRTPKGGE